MYTYIHLMSTFTTEIVLVLTLCTVYTVEPPNKGHFGDKINSESAVVSFVEREVVLSSEVQNVLELYTGKQIFGP